MRTVKEPDIRKQEILDGAIRVFAEYGYDKTTIATLSKALGISQGLCYRYFSSKEEIYEAAIEKYADLLLVEELENHRKNLSVRAWIDNIGMTITKLMKAEERAPQLYALFHSRSGNPMHDRLLLRLTEKMVPHVQQVLRQACVNGELSIEDPERTAIIGLYGAMGILHTTEMTEEEQAAAIRMGWKRLLGL